MKRFHIHEVDRDYNSWVGCFVMEFSNLEEAMKYCKEQTWSGYYYYAEEFI